MAEKGIRHLVGNEITPLIYEQAGFDFVSKDDRDHDGEEYTLYYPGVGTNNSNIIYFGNTDPNAYWIGIHNCGTSGDEVISVMAESLVGDNLTKDLTNPLDFSAGVKYIELAGKDIIHGKFSRVGILKTDSGIYIDNMRLIRGV